MVQQEAMEITEDEAELYDRQIRLWGIESQRKLRNARILIVGMNGFAAEVAKNIILAGVKSVVFQDSSLVTVEDSSAQFFIPVGELGKNRAEASIKRAQALNPMVNLSADTSDIFSKDAEYFGQFDVVIATGCSLQQQVGINELCRSKNVKFFCGDVFGMFGYYFSDLLHHKFTVRSVNTGNKSADKDQVTSENTVDYVPLKQGYEDLKKGFTPKKLAKMDPSVFVMMILHKFKEKYNRAPNRSQREDDLVKLTELRDAVVKEFDYPPEKISEGLLGSLFGEVSPACGVLGGVLAQDVIKAVSESETPMLNFFFFNPSTCKGMSMFSGTPKPTETVEQLDLICE